MTRDEMIERLVRHTVDETMHNPDGASLSKVLEERINRYRYMPYLKLKRELELCGLAEDEAQTDEFDDAEHASADEYELMVMLSGMVGGQQLHLDTE